MKLPIRDIRLDCGTQSRASLNQDTINQYAEDMTEGAVFPPPVVFYDGEKYILSVGFHRVHAALQAGYSDMECEVKPGTLRDAILFSIKSNADHGLPRTNADKKHAVKMAIEILLADGVLLSKITGAMLHDMTEVSRRYANEIKADYENKMSMFGNCSQTSTIPPKSKQTSSEDTQRLKDELARLRAEKEALAERERMEVQSRVKAEGELMSIRNQYEHLLESARKEQSKKVEYITPPDVEDELEALRLENSRIAAALEEAKRVQSPVALPEPKVERVEVEVIKEVVPPTIQAKLREQEEQIRQMSMRGLDEQRAREKKIKMELEIESLRDELNRTRSEAGFRDALDVVSKAEIVVKKLVSMADEGMLTVEMLDETEGVLMAMITVGNNGCDAIRHIKGHARTGGKLHAL